MQIEESLKRTLELYCFTQIQHLREHLEVFVKKRKINKYLLVNFVGIIWGIPQLSSQKKKIKTLPKLLLI
jgi:hypothetical protein